MPLAISGTPEQPEIAGNNLKVFGCSDSVSMFRSGGRGTVHGLLFNREFKKTTAILCDQAQFRPSAVRYQRLGLSRGPSAGGRDGAEWATPVFTHTYQTIT
jgi:hypothetical protein